MLLVILFGCVLSICEVSTAVNTIPDILSLLPSSDKPLLDKIKAKQEKITCQECIPVGCYCDLGECNARVRAIEAPVKDLLTKDGKTVKSLEVQAYKGDLMFIILIDPNSTLGIGNYLERVSYWILADGPHRILPQSSLKLKITLKSSFTEIHDEQAQFHVEAKLVEILIGSFKLTFDSETIRREEIIREADYEFRPSPFGQIAGVYQLVQEYVVRPTTALAECGILRFLPPLQHKTSYFQQYARTTEGNNREGISNGDQLDLAVEVSKGSAHQIRLTGRNKSIRIILVFIGLILLGGFTVAIVYLPKHRYRQSRYTVVAQEFPLE